MFIQRRLRAHSEPGADVVGWADVSYSLCVNGAVLGYGAHRISPECINGAISNPLCSPLHQLKKIHLWEKYFFLLGFDCWLEKVGKRLEKEKTTTKKGSANVG